MEFTVEQYCTQLHTGQWFCFHDPKNKSLDTLQLTDYGKEQGYDLPTKQEFADWKKQKILETKIQQAKSEATRRIQAKWDTHGQVNAALGVYPKDQQQACKECIDSHRQALQDLIAIIKNDGNPEGIDISDNKYWP